MSETSSVPDAAAMDPIHLAAAKFLYALREEQAEQALTLLREYPQLAAYNIHTAAAIGRPAQVAAFLRADTSRATRHAVPDNTEPILYAAHGGLQDLLGVSEHDRVQTVALLLDAGASANAFRVLPHDPQAIIPALYFACVSNNVSVARLLLDRGANVNDGESVFHAAERNYRECLALLAEHGADLSGAHAQWGNTPLYFLACYKEGQPHTASATAGLQWLLEHGADPNVVSHAGLQHDGTPGIAETPLHRIADGGRPAEVARMLVAHGARVDAPRGDDKTAYVLARRAGNVAVAEYLATLGADTSTITNADRFTEACLRNDARSARALYEAHVDVRDAVPPTHYDVFIRAVETDCADSVKALLDLGWSLTDEGTWGGTPLHWSAWHGSVNTARMLVARGAPVNVRDREYGSSPIAWAAHGSHFSRRVPDAHYVALTQLCISHGATTSEAYNRWNESPLTFASAAVAEVLRPWLSSDVPHKGE